jgi:uncharacterized protein RhaS with RHS repeats
MSPAHYNYFRDYEPAVGRYVESDPIGLRAGLNTYAYVYDSPLLFSDYLGLDTYQCTRRLNNVPFRAGPLYHQFVCTGDAGNGYSCGGLGPGGKNPFDSPGQIELDRYIPQQCEKVHDNNVCLQDCLQRKLKSPPPNYSLDLSRGENCQSFAYRIQFECEAECKVKRK